jgi:hypothetical protein
MFLLRARLRRRDGGDTATWLYEVPYEPDHFYLIQAARDAVPVTLPLSPSPLGAAFMVEAIDSDEVPDEYWPKGLIRQELA